MVSMGTNGSKGANATCSWTPWGWWWPGGSKPPMSRTDAWGRGCLAAYNLASPSIRTVMADAGYESRKLARELKRRHGWRLHITKRRKRAFKVVGLTWIVKRTFAWLARNRRLSKDYPVEGPKLRKPSSTWRPSASCSNGSPRGKTSQTPSQRHRACPRLHARGLDRQST